MQLPNAITAMPSTISCDAAMSDAVLQAARAAMPADPARQFADPSVITCLPAKQQPLLPLVMALLDSLEAVTKAIDDNAWDDGHPIDRGMAEDLANQSYRIAAALTNASQAHDVRGWNLPSMTGKELV